MKHHPPARVEWTCAPDLPDPEPSSLDVWRLELDRLPCHTEFLDAREQIRLQDFKHNSARTQFCVTRTALRTILGRYLERSPVHVSIEILEGGKPHLAAPHPPLHFNLTHTNNLALLAIRNQHAVGIDIERPHPIPGMQRIARRMFSQREIENLEARDWPLQLFFETWSHMEARQKCLGRGVFGKAVLSDEVETHGFSLSDDFYAAIAWQREAPPKVINYYRATS